VKILTIFTFAICTAEYICLKTFAVFLQTEASFAVTSFAMLHIIASLFGILVQVADFGLERMRISL
jgi:hypothetical protein